MGERADRREYEVMRVRIARDGKEALEERPVDVADDLGAEERAPAVLGNGERESIDEAAGAFDVSRNRVGDGEGYTLEVVIDGASSRVRRRLIP